MTETVVVTLDTRELDRIARKLDKTTQEIIEAAAFEIERMAKRMAPLKTGALKNSIYTATKDGNNTPTPLHGESMSPLPSPSGKVLATVGPAVEYGIYVELGTSRMGSQPYLGPASEYIARKINSGEYWKELLR